jgi:hypothetical protein
MRGLGDHALLENVESGNAVRLGHGWKVENLLDEEIRASAGRNRRLAQVHQFGRAFAEHLATEHAAAIALTDQRQEAVRLAGNMRPRHFGKIRTSDQHIDVLGSRLGLRKPHAGDFRNGVNTGGHQAGRRRWRQPQRCERCASALIRCGAGQRRRTDGIAGRKNSRDIGFEAFVDLHMPARADGQLHPLQADAVEIRDTAEGREHDVGGQRRTAAELHFDLRKAVKPRAAHLAAAAVFAAHGFKAAQVAAAQRRVQKTQGLGGLVQQDDAAAQGRKYRRVLAGDHAAAEHDHGTRNVRQA